MSEIARYDIAVLRERPLSEKKSKSRREWIAERAAELPEARQVTAVVLDTFRKILVVNSDGLIAPDEKTYFQTVRASRRRKRRTCRNRAWKATAATSASSSSTKSAPESIGEEAARRVKVLLDAKPAPAGTMPVVIAAEAGGTMIHEAVGHGLEADLACNGLSVYQGKLDQQVASPLITVLDDGTMPGKRGSYAFDDEGTPRSETF